MADLTKRNWEYDTKCRRCGKLQYWVFGPREQIPVAKFYMAMDLMITDPGTYPCKKCNKKTVQDVVSYD